MLIALVIIISLRQQVQTDANCYFCCLAFYFGLNVPPICASHPVLSANAKMVKLKSAKAVAGGTAQLVLLFYLFIYLLFWLAQTLTDSEGLFGCFKEAGSLMPTTLRRPKCDC